MEWQVPAADGLKQAGVMADSSRLVVSLSGNEVEPDLRRLSSSISLKGPVKMSYEREPDFFHSLEIEGSHIDVVTARLAARVVGFATQTIRLRYVDGAPENVAYLGMARVEPGMRGRQVSPQAFTLFRQVQKAHDVSRVISSVITDKKGVHAFPQDARDGIPGFQPIAKICTLVIPIRTAPAMALPTGIRQARRKDLEGIVQCLNRNNQHLQYAEVWAESDILSTRRTRGLNVEDFFISIQDGQVTGCVAVWDQREFKQTRINGYRGALKLARPIVNTISRPLARPRLPDAGALFEFAFLSHLAVDDDNPELTGQLLNSIVNFASRQRNLPNLVLGLDVGDHRLPMVAQSLGGMQYRTTLCRVVWPIHRCHRPLLNESTGQRLRCYESGTGTTDVFYRAVKKRIGR